MRQRVHKNTVELLLFWRLLLDMPPAPKCALLSQLDSSGENNFSFASGCQVKIPSWLRLGAPDFPFSALEPSLAWTWAVLCMLPVSVSTSGHQSWLLRVIPSPGSHSLPMFFSAQLPEPWREGFDVDIPPRTMLPSLSGCTLSSCGSLS